MSVFSSNQWSELHLPLVGWDGGGGGGRDWGVAAKLCVPISGVSGVVGGRDKLQMTHTRLL